MKPELAIESLRGLVLMLDLQLDGRNFARAAIILDAIQCLPAEPLPAVLLAQVEIGDDSLHSAEFEIVVEGQNYITRERRAVTNDPDASERLIAQQLAQCGANALRIEGDAVVTVVLADQLKQPRGVGCSSEADLGAFRSVRPCRRFRATLHEGLNS